MEDDSTDNPTRDWPLRLVRSGPQTPFLRRSKSIIPLQVTDLSENVLWTSVSGSVHDRVAAHLIGTMETVAWYEGLVIHPFTARL